MFKLGPKAVQTVAWRLAFLVCLLAFISWGNNNFWSFIPLSTYQLFPLLGLLAFSLMWTHYVVGVLKETSSPHPEKLKDYYHWTGYAVLLLICLHPGLLVYQLFRDGAGLPPGSYEKYAPPGLSWVVTLGFVSLLIFLAFELHRFFGKRKWWRYVADLSDLAMLAILYHGLRLGGQLSGGWYRYVWFFYGIILVLILIRKYWLRLNPGMQKVRP